MRPLWLAAGTLVVLGALALGAGTRERAVGNAVAHAPAAEVPFANPSDPALRAAPVAVARAATDGAGVIVPRASVVFVAGRPFVFVPEPDLRLFVATPVELREPAGEEQRVTAGLVAG